MFITIVMTGLDQDQMQKNLTIKNLKDAQKNVVSYGLAFAPINLLFLSLGVLLLIFAQQDGVVLPEVSDNILPVIASQHLGQAVLGIFITGIVAAAFSSADSALTALNIVLRGYPGNEKDRKSRYGAQEHYNTPPGASVYKYYFCSYYPADRGHRLRQHHHCDLQTGLIHLRPAARIVFLRSVYPGETHRQMGTVRCRCCTGYLLRI